MKKRMREIIDRQVVSKVGSFVLRHTTQTENGVDVFEPPTIRQNAFGTKFRASIHARAAHDM